MPLNALMPLNDGAIFAGFRIVRRLGSGGMGEVYLIQHPRLPRRNALKILSADLSADPEYRARFNREADLASTLYHPHIVGVHDRGEYNGQLWLSMDFVDGQDAARLLADRYPAGMPVDMVLSIITAVASALDYAHRQGLLHRDVKPANIMLTHVDDDGEQRILLTDFGIARSVDDISGLTTTNMTVGTVAYSAPEQLMGEEIDGRADQYALAATAYHLLTGLQLFPHSNPAVAISRHLNAAPPVLADTRPELAALDPVLAAALAKNPDQRFASCSDFARAFADQVSPTSLAIPIAPTASAPLPLAGTSSVDAVAEDSGAEKVSSHHAPEVANDPAADSASDAPTQQALVSAGKARLAESDEIEPPPTPRSPMRGGTSQAPQQSEPSSVSSTPAPIPVITLPRPKRERHHPLVLDDHLGAVLALCWWWGSSCWRGRHEHRPARHRVGAVPPRGPRAVVPRRQGAPVQEAAPRRGDLPPLPDPAGLPAARTGPRRTARHLGWADRGRAPGADPATQAPRRRTPRPHRQRSPSPSVTAGAAEVKTRRRR